MVRSVFPSMEGERMSGQIDRPGPGDMWTVTLGNIFVGIARERARQVEKFGARQYEEISEEACLAVLTEEVGKVAHVLNELRLGDTNAEAARQLEAELVRTATVCVAWLQALGADRRGIGA